MILKFLSCFLTSFLIQNQLKPSRNILVRHSIFKSRISFYHSLFMKRYFQVMSNGHEATDRSPNDATKKPRRVFQPLSAIISDPAISQTAEKVESSINESKEEDIPRAAAVVNKLPNIKFVTDSNLFLISLEDKLKAQTLPMDRWIASPNMMVKLSSSVDLSTRKGVLVFDMDGTIITTKSGKTFPTNKHDWKLFDASVPTRLLESYEAGYALAVISNQKGVKDSQSQRDIQEKFDGILKVLSVPIDVICSHQNDIYRKPLTGMWEFLYEARFRNLPTPLTADSCTYIGDAAGRAQHGTRKKDFSDTDYKFALNVGIQFQTPERFFLHSTQRLHNEFPLPENPLHPATLAPSSSLWNDNLFVSTSSPEIVLLVAAPASGKSSLAREFARRGYVRINQDELKDFPACVKAAKAALKNQQSIVIDNTNLNPTVRASWLKLAKEENTKIRCIVLRVPKEICMTLASYRLADPMTLPEDRRKIETVVFHKFFKDQVLPRLEDGYERVDTVDWSPRIPESPLSQRLFSMYIV